MDLPGYDEWKTRSPYDDMSPLDEANAEIRALEDQIAILSNMLDECASYFNERSDVIDGDYGIPAPNEEMQMLQRIEEVLK